jgi:hypothetical protein
MQTRSKDDIIFFRNMIDLLVLGCVGTALIYSGLLLLNKISFGKYLPAVGLAFGSVGIAVVCNVYKDGRINHD